MLPVKMEEPMIKAEEDMDHPSADKSNEAGEDALPSADNLLELPPAKASKAKFPPGCPVLCIDSRDALVSRGTVVSVSIDLSPTSNREDIYTIERVCDTTIIARQHELQWAPSCRVWVKVSHDSDWTPAVVKGSYQESTEAAPLYSVQVMDATSTRHFHGIEETDIRFRDEEYTPSDSGGNQPVLLLEQDYSKDYDSAQMPESYSEEQAFDADQPSPLKPTQPTMVSPETSKKLATTDSLSSLPPYDFANDGDMSCTAELCIPWRVVNSPGLSDSLCHQICHAVQHCTDCQAFVLQRADESNAGSILLEGRDVANVQGACMLVVDFLCEYMHNASASKMDALLQLGWSVSVYNMETNEIERCEWALSSFKEPPPTTLAVASSYEEDQMDTDGRPVDHNDDYQLPGEKAQSIKPVRLSATLDSASSAEPPTEDVPSAGELMYASHTVANTDMISRQLVLPEFLDKTFLMDTFIGLGGRVAKSLSRECGCDITVMGLDSQDRSRNPISVKVTGVDAKSRSALRILEDRLISNAPVDQRGNLLFALAECNNYGTGTGVARYQRSPTDPNVWLWMASIYVPVPEESIADFTALFVSTKGTGVGRLKRSSGCWDIWVNSTSYPPHIFITNPKEEPVNRAVEEALQRMEWAFSELKMTQGLDLGQQTY